MRNNEPIDLAKAAIGIMLLCLLIGATVSFFYMIYDKTDERIDSMQKAATSSNMERLYELQDKTLADTGDMSGYPQGRSYLLLSRVCKKPAVRFEALAIKVGYCGV